MRRQRETTAVRCGLPAFSAAGGAPTVWRLGAVERRLRSPWRDVCSSRSWRPKSFQSSTRSWRPSRSSRRRPTHFRCKRPLSSRQEVCALCVCARAGGQACRSCFLCACVDGSRLVNGCSQCLTQTKCSRTTNKTKAATPRRAARTWCAVSSIEARAGQRRWSPHTRRTRRTNHNPLCSHSDESQRKPRSGCCNSERILQQRRSWWRVTAAGGGHRH
jgi:hypothetical protein